MLNLNGLKQKTVCRQFGNLKGYQLESPYPDHQRAKYNDKTLTCYPCHPFFKGISKVSKFTLFIFFTHLYFYIGELSRKKSDGLSMNSICVIKIGYQMESPYPDHQRAKYNDKILSLYPCHSFFKGISKVSKFTLFIFFTLLYFPSPLSSVSINVTTYYV